MKRRCMGIFLVLCMTLSLLPATASATENGVAINETNFPDALFREKVAEYDKNNDGVLSDTEISNIRSISINGDSSKGGDVTDLKGIEYFTSLTRLQCGHNKISKLDVSKNTALTELYCPNNELTELDLGNNTALGQLTVTNNQLKELDISKDTALTYLACANNQLKELNVSKNTALTELSCSYNQLTELNVNNNTALTRIDCGSNQLSELDVSKNTALTYLSCGSNKGNKLTKLDVSNNTELMYLEFWHNEITSIDLSKNTALKNLSCYKNKLTELDLSKNTALTNLLCGDNELTSLDLSKNTALKSLECFSNKLTALDLSNNTNLEVLRCNDNKLTSLDLSNNTLINGFSGKYNIYNITADSDRRINLSDLPGSFDVSKASNWKGGTVSGNVLTVNENAEFVTYTYDCGSGQSVDFNLRVTVDEAPAHTHTYGEWNNDETNHWHECSDASCTDKSGSVKDLAEHTFEWKVDKEATETATGLKHEECSVCGYKRNENTVIEKIEKIPADISNNTPAPVQTVPETGDNSNLIFWLAVMFISAGSLVGATVVCKEKMY